MSINPSNPSDDVLTFLAERHLASLTLVRADGTPHVTPVGFSYEPETRTARIITWSASLKARLTTAAPLAAAVCQVDGGRWLTLSGTARCTDDPTISADAVARYAARYRQPKERDDRVVIEIQVDRIMGRA